MTDTSHYEAAMDLLGDIGDLEEYEIPEAVPVLASVALVHAVLALVDALAAGGSDRAAYPQPGALACGDPCSEMHTFAGGQCLAVE